MARTEVLKRSGLCFATYSPYVTLGVCMPPYLAGRFTCGRGRAGPKDSPPAARRSFFVCARKPAHKHTSLPARPR